jgi:hypothetical protein
MPDESQLRRQVLLRLAGSVTVLTPGVLGTSVALGFWALDWNPGLVLFSALAGLTGSVGALFTRALLGGPELRAAVKRELEQAERQGHESDLDQLDRWLTQADGDPRPEAALRDLRAFRTSFEHLAGRPAAANSMLAAEVLSQVRLLADRAVASLRQTMDLQRTVSRLNTPAAAAPLLAERERLIAEVQATVQQLGHTLAAMQALGTESNGSELRRLRTELDDSLLAARRAEARLEAMLASPGRDFQSPSSGAGI